MAAVGPSCGSAPWVNPVVREGWFWSILRCGLKGLVRSKDQLLAQSVTSTWAAGGHRCA